MTDDVRGLIDAKRYTEAFEQLLDKYETKVFHMAMAVLRDAGRAEEVTQDIFLKLWRSLPAYDGRAAVGTWLYTIARNSCLSAARSESYRRNEILDASREPCAADIPEPDFELMKCIDQLPESQRLVIRLFYLEEKRIEEVAEMLGMPQGTVKSHLHRARVALGEMMKR
jgi:RNA polymerase sigma-70 factor (ECF subfamily)